MIIQCGKCKARYKVDSSKIPSSGLKVSCKKCKNIIPVHKDDSQKSQQPKAGNPEKLKKIVEKIGDLPPMPHVAMKVLELVQKKETSNEDLREVISKDQALTAQILKFSNSAMYSCVREIRTLSDALVVLGFNTLKSLVITSATQAVYKKKKIGLIERKLWEHSVATGIGARELGKFIRFTNSEEAFVGGLLHDIGKVVLCQEITEEYNQIVQNVYNSEEYFIDIEFEALGFDHTDVGNLLVEKWKFAEVMIEGIRFHHTISESSADSRTLVCLINCADNIANKNGFGLEGSDTNIDLSSIPSAKYLEIKKESLEEMERKILEILDSDKDMMTI